MHKGTRTEQQKEVLKRYQAFEMHAARLLAGWLPGIERWEVKHEVGIHLREDAKHSQALRTRLWELRVPDPDRGVIDGVLSVIDALAGAQTDGEFLTGMYLALKRSLLDAYKDYIATTFSVYDAPSVAMLKPIILEKEGQLAWAGRVLNELNDSGEKKRSAARWLDYCRQVLAAYGGVGGQAQRTNPPVPLPGYSNLLPFDEAKRDDRFKLDVAPLAVPSEDNPLDYTLFQFSHYGAEMQAAETLGSILWETDDMPWEFYFDLAHHCSDEVRHSKLGEVRLEQLGHHISDFPHTTGNYAWRQLVDPLRRFCALTYVIEADSFDYKHRSYQYYLEQGDQESAEAVLYDIMDETLHVRWGKKWVPELMKRYHYRAELGDLIDECRELVLKHSLSVKQRELAAAKGA